MLVVPLAVVNTTVLFALVRLNPPPFIVSVPALEIVAGDRESRVIVPTGVGGVYVIPVASAPGATLESRARFDRKNNSIPNKGTSFVVLTNTKPPFVWAFGIHGSLISFAIFSPGASVKAAAGESWGPPMSVPSGFIA